MGNSNNFYGLLAAGLIFIAVSGIAFPPVNALQVIALTTRSHLGGNSSVQCVISQHDGLELALLEVKSEGLLLAQYDFKTSRLRKDPSEMDSRFSYDHDAMRIIVIGVRCADMGKVFSCVVSAAKEGSGNVQATGHVTFEFEVPPQAPSVMELMPKGRRLTPPEALTASCSAQVGLPGQGSIVWRIYRLDGMDTVGPDDPRVNNTTGTSTAPCAETITSTLHLPEMTSASPDLSLACFVTNKDTHPYPPPVCNSPTRDLCQRSHTITVKNQERAVTIHNVDVGIPWKPELLEKSSPYAMLVKVYVIAWVNETLRQCTTYIRSNVEGFGPGVQSTVANLTITEWTDDAETDVTSKLQQTIELDLAYGKLQQYRMNYTAGSTISIATSTPSSNNTIMEDSPANITCLWLAVTSQRSTANVTWHLDGHLLDPEKSDLLSVFTTVKDVEEPFSGLVGGAMKGQVFRSTLFMPKFDAFLSGEYKCTLKSETNGSHTTELRSWSKSLNVSLKETILRPKSLLSPSLISLFYNTTFTVSCIYSDADDIRIVDARNNGTLKRRSLKRLEDGDLTLTASFLNDTVLSCVARNRETGLSAWSSDVKVHVFDSASDLCRAFQDSRGVTWHTAPTGTEVRTRCPDGYTGYTCRQCLKGGEWDSASYVRCRKPVWARLKQELDKLKTVLVISKDSLKAVLTSLTLEVSQSDRLLSGDIRQLVEILADVATTIGSSQRHEEEALITASSLKEVLVIGNKLLSSDPEAWRELHSESVRHTDSFHDTSQMFVDSMDALSRASLSDHKLLRHPAVFERIVLQQGDLDGQGLTFPDDSTEGSSSTPKDWVTSSGVKAQLSFGPGNETASGRYSILLYRAVRELFDVVPALQSNYTSGQVFGDTSLTSGVLSVALSGQISHASPSIKITFKTGQLYGSKSHCGFLNATGSLPRFWSTSGCLTLKPKKESSDQVVCECKHLSTFAVFTHLVPPANPPSKVLSDITLIGCLVSISCLTLTLIIHFVMWKEVKSDKAVLHILVSVMLTLAYSTFLVGVEKTEKPIVCNVIAALLHYFFMVAFFLMLVEGVELMLSLIFIFDKKAKLWMLLLPAFGVPGVIVGASVAVGHQSGYTSQSFCWLGLDNNMFWAFVGPVLFVFVVNFLVLVKILHIAISSTTMLSKGTKDKAKSVAWALCVLSPMLGVTWLVGVFLVNKGVTIFHYLFAVCNCLQGIQILIFHCILSPQVQKGFKSLLRRWRAKSYHPDQHDQNGHSGVYCVGVHRNSSRRHHSHRPRRSQRPQHGQPDPEGVDENATGTRGSVPAPQDTAS